MIKVCHMTSAHMEEDVRIFHKECVSLAKAGYDVYLTERGGTYEKSGVHIVGVGEIPASRFRRMTKGAKAVYKAALRVDADVYHIHDPELLPYGLKLKKRGKIVVFDSHEYYTEQIRSKPYLPQWLARIVASAYGKYEKAVLRRIDAAVIPTTIHGRDPFAGVCRQPRRNQVCYVGAITENRGITHSIRAAAAAGADLALAGAISPESYGAQLRAMEAYSCVDYRGVLDRRGVAELIGESSVGLCTLLDRGQYWSIETLPIKAYEYMSAGLPVILHASEYNRELTERCRFGLCVDPEDTDAYAQAVRYLLDHPDEARMMGENGRRLIETEFNWDNEERKLIALYRTITEEHAK